MVIEFEPGTDVANIINFMCSHIAEHDFVSVGDLLTYFDENKVTYKATPPFPSRDRVDDWGWTEVYYSTNGFRWEVRVSDPVMNPAGFGADNVNHPKHYISKNGIETIDVIQAFTEDLKGIEATDTGNIVKYISRWKKKNGLEDLKKARWYLDHLIAHVEKEDRYKIDTTKYIL